MSSTLRPKVAFRNPPFPRFTLAFSPPRQRLDKREKPRKSWPFPFPEKFFKKSFDSPSRPVQAVPRHEIRASKTRFLPWPLLGLCLPWPRFLLVLRRLSILTLKIQNPMNYPQSIPAAYQSADLEKAYRLGWNHGHGIACHNVPAIGDSIDRSVDWVGLGKTVTLDNIAEYHEALCFAAESNSREFSPFEFIAHEFNESDDPESLWEAFEAGTSDSIREDLKGYSYVETV